ncbi:hypothetical protein QMN58_32170, partial [Escherichia coli]|nr:hypothetical protein [Escherichia coli]
ADSVDAVLRERGARGIDNAYDSADAALKRSRLASQQALNDERIKLTELQIGVLTGRGAERGLSLHRPQLAAAAQQVHRQLRRHWRVCGPKPHSRISTPRGRSFIPT